MKVRIKETPHESEIDGVPLHRLAPGAVREVSPSIGAWLVTEGYADPEMDKLIDQAASEINDQERTKLYVAFQKKVMTDLPIIPLVDFPFLSVVSDKVVNHHNTPRWPVASWPDVSLA